MDNDIIRVFDNPEFGEIRTINEGGNPLFCAKDVATALGYANTNDAINKHCRGVAKRYPISDALGRTQDARFVSEGDMYRLVASSKLEGAQRFESWIFDDVVPTIRRTGSYSVQDDTLQMAYGLLAADKIVKRLQAENSGLAAENAALAPKAAYYDSVMDADGLLSVRDSAKLLKSHDDSITEHGLRARLRADHIIEQRTIKATAYGIERGYVRERLFSFTRDDGQREIKHYGCLTPKGLDWCIRRYCREVA